MRFFLFAASLVAAASASAVLNQRVPSGPPTTNSPSSTPTSSPTTISPSSTPTSSPTTSSPTSSPTTSMTTANTCSTVSNLCTGGHFAAEATSYCGSVLGRPTVTSTVTTSAKKGQATVTKPPVCGKQLKELKKAPTTTTGAPACLKKASNITATCDCLGVPATLTTTTTTNVAAATVTGAFKLYTPGGPDDGDDLPIIHDYANVYHVYLGAYGGSNNYCLESHGWLTDCNSLGAWEGNGSEGVEFTLKTTIIQQNYAQILCTINEENCILTCKAGPQGTVGTSFSCPDYQNNWNIGLFTPGGECSAFTPYVTT